MPSSWNGIGTMYRSFGTPDQEGWMMATVWSTFLYIPIAPLRRERVRILRDVSSSYREFEVAGTTPLSFSEVMKTYFFSWIFVPIFVGWPFALALYLQASAPRLEDEAANPFEPPWWSVAIPMLSTVVLAWLSVTREGRRFEDSMRARGQQSRIPHQ